MATGQINRLVRKIEKPRLNFQRNTKVAEVPNQTVNQDIFMYIDEVIQLLEQSKIDTRSARFFSEQLQANAALLESNHKDELDRAFVAIRYGCQDEKLNIVTRIHLLEMVELRSRGWQNQEPVDSLYQQRIMTVGNNEPMTPETPTSFSNSNMLAPSASPPLLGPGDVLRNSGKFAKPTRIPGKNYCKDEVVIKNSDSGKVNPGARERLVQITGTSEDKITLAKGFIKETIQRNASPVRMEQVGDKSGMGDSSSSLNSGNSDESNRFVQSPGNNMNNSYPPQTWVSPTYNRDESSKFVYTVKVGNQDIKISGNDHELVKSAKLALDRHFQRENVRKTISPVKEILASEPVLLPRSLFKTSDVVEAPISKASENGQLVGIETEGSLRRSNGIKMSRDFLLACSRGPLAKMLPADWERIKREVPDVIPTKAPNKWFEPDVYKAKVASAGFLTVLVTGESENDNE